MSKKEKPKKVKCSICGKEMSEEENCGGDCVTCVTEAEEQMP